jgi:hypothetical protein
MLVDRHFSKRLEASFPSSTNANSNNNVSEGQNGNLGLKIHNQMEDLSWPFVLGAVLRCPGGCKSRA